MLIIAIPFSASSFPVIPFTSQEGDHLHMIAISHLLRLQIFSVFLAPIRNCSVISSPVTYLRKLLSSHVMKTLPLRRLTGGLGTLKPPKTSGHTGISFASGYCSRYLRTKVLTLCFLPCHRQGSPIRHLDIKIFISNLYTILYFLSIPVFIFLKKKEVF